MTVGLTVEAFVGKFTERKTDESDSSAGEKTTDRRFLLRMLTLYLSTMGSLTGPSLDLLKFGKLSRWGMNGKPLRERKG